MLRSTVCIIFVSVPLLDLVDIGAAREVYVYISLLTLQWQLRLETVSCLICLLVCLFVCLFVPVHKVDFEPRVLSFILVEGSGARKIPPCLTAQYPL